jgi:flagellar hook-length control protein FliK
MAPLEANAREVSSPSPPDAPVTKNRRSVRSSPAKTSSVVDVAEKPLVVVMTEAYVRDDHINETRLID